MTLDMQCSTAACAVSPEQLQSWQGFVGLFGGVSMTSEPLHNQEYAPSLRELETLTQPVPERGRSFLPGMETVPSLFGFLAERPCGHPPAQLGLGSWSIHIKRST
jgi:hypothetical protein